MNIFVLDKDPGVAARLQCDRHVVKMTLESAQILSTAHRLLDGDPEADYQLPDEREPALYRATHIHHPCVAWATNTSGNYHWLLAHFEQLCAEYTFRYDRTHACETQLLEPLRQRPHNLPKRRRTHFAIVTGQDNHQLPSAPAVQSYRRLYLTKQRQFPMTWTRRPIPPWITPTP